MRRPLPWHAAARAGPGRGLAWLRIRLYRTPLQLYCTGTYVRKTRSFRGCDAMDGHAMDVRWMGTLGWVLLMAQKHASASHAFSMSCSTATAVSINTTATAVRLYYYGCTRY
eukprot:COSAG01_NODE_2233_length_8112_cov_41.569699_7_plen_112_part_00